MTVEIMEIDKTSGLWNDLLEVCESFQNQSSKWISHTEDYFISSHTLIAIKENEEIVGVFRFSTSNLGADLGRQAVIFEGHALVEAIVWSFGVRGDCRNLGIGKKLQAEALKLAKSQGCYQTRAKVRLGDKACFHMKLLQNCGIQPSEKSDSVFFVKVL